MNIVEKKNVDKLTVSEFRQEGLLQELNRLFLHPRGLSMSVVVNDEGEEVFDMYISDVRGTPDVFTLPESLVGSTTSLENVDHVAESFNKESRLRQQKLGYVVQSLEA